MKKIGGMYYGRHFECAAQHHPHLSVQPRRQGAKVVMKNNSPECVLLSPEEYLRLIDEVNDAKLAALAAQRMQGFDPADAISAEEVYRQNGITKAALDSMDEVEFE